MELNLVNIPIGLLTLVPLVLIFFGCARRLPLGALSLPCMMVLTSFIYFYLMPVFARAAGDTGFFGMYLDSLGWAHFAVLLYVLGALVAFLVHWRVLSVHPGAPRRNERQIAKPVFYALWGVVAAGVAFQILSGKLNLTGAGNYQFATDRIREFAFVTQAYNMMVPLTLILLIRNNFKLWSLVFAAVVVVVFLQIGFRFRVMIFLTAAVVSFAIARNIKIRVAYALGGAVVALYLANLIGSLRRYGRGLDLSQVDQVAQIGPFTSFGGEIGIVYVLAYTAENPLPNLAMFEPWLVGVARLVPSFLWPDKPTAGYMRHFIAGAQTNAEGAGVAASQHVEMLLQFGWISLPILAFFYFTIATSLIGRLHRLGREARIAGCAIVPAFFGFYMQTRGYFFQIFADSLFFFGPLFLVHMPLFLVHIWERRSRRALSARLPRQPS